VVLDILERSGQQVECLLELNPRLKNVFNYPVFNESDFSINNQHKVIIAIGDNKKRSLIAAKHNVSFGIAKHPDASISEHSTIGVGSMIMAKSVINPDTTVGEHCIINTGAVVEHDCMVGNYAHVSPGAVICGGVTIAEGVHVGAGAVILPSLKIGSWSTIGAGAIVTKNIPEGSVVVGNPGRIIE
jgi:acetyltransferase EpsM